MGNNMPTLAERYEELAIANRILFDQEIVDGLGHISFRDPTDPTQFHMSRALAPGRVTPDDILAFQANGEPVDARGRSVYQERFIHSEVYRARPDVMAVVHSHSPTVIPFSVTTGPMIPIRAGFLYPEVPKFEIRDHATGWTNLLVSTPQLGEALARTLGSNSCALMRGHGNVVVGRDVPAVVSRAIKMEADAKLILQATMLGGPITYLAPEEGAMIEKMSSVTVRGSEQGVDRTWNMWKDQALAHHPF
jgi:ribulose-5-phosphate 4-epimerase/fuculose-1-phosphate aldolase